MAQLEGIAPIVPVRDEVASIAFYVHKLGFTLRFHNADARYALLARDEAAVALIGARDEAALKATANNISAYIWVADLDGLWAEMALTLAELPEGRVRAPFHQDYGMREFHVKDPDGFLIFFGEAPSGDT